MPVLAINQAIGQVDQDEFTLTLGEMTPPPVVGTPEQRRAQIASVEYVPIRAVGRFAMNRRRVEELIRVLQQTLVLSDRQLELRNETESETGEQA